MSESVLGRLGERMAGEEPWLAGLSYGMLGVRGAVITAGAPAGQGAAR